MDSIEKDSISQAQIPMLNLMQMADKQKHLKVREEKFMEMGRNAFGTQFNIKKLIKEPAVPRSTKNY